MRRKRSKDWLPLCWPFHARDKASQGRDALLCALLLHNGVAVSFFFTLACTGYVGCETSRLLPSQKLGTHLYVMTVMSLSHHTPIQNWLNFSVLWSAQTAPRM